MSEYRVLSTFFIEGTQSPIYETSRGILYPFIGNDRVVRWKSESEIRLLLVERNILQGEANAFEELFKAAKKYCSIV